MLYFLFVMNDFYERGGVYDYIRAFSTLGEAQAAYTVGENRSAHVAIVEDEGLKIISASGGWLPSHEGARWRVHDAIGQEWRDIK